MAINGGAMDMRKCILKDGEIQFVDLLTWARWYDEPANRRVAETHVGEARISTVFLGIDHNFGYGAALWFETMIFGGEHDEYQERYSTLDEARRGHDRVVALCERSAADGDPQGQAGGAGGGK